MTSTVVSTAPAPPTSTLDNNNNNIDVNSNDATSHSHVVSVIHPSLFNIQSSVQQYLESHSSTITHLTNQQLYEYLYETYGEIIYEEEYVEEIDQLTKQILSSYNLPTNHHENKDDSKDNELATKKEQVSETEENKPDDDVSTKDTTTLATSTAATASHLSPHNMTSTVSSYLPLFDGFLPNLKRRIIDSLETTKHIEIPTANCYYHVDCYENIQGTPSFDQQMYDKRNMIVNIPINESMTHLPTKRQREEALQTIQNPHINQILLTKHLPSLMQHRHPTHNVNTHHMDVTISPSKIHSSPNSSPTLDRSVSPPRIYDEDMVNPLPNTDTDSSNPNANKLLTISDSLAKFLHLPLGSKLTRSVCIKLINDYVKQNNLQDPSDRRIIILDESLSNLFPGQQYLTYFTLSRHLGIHFKASKHDEKGKKGSKKKSGSSGAQHPSIPGTDSGVDLYGNTANDDNNENNPRGFNAAMKLSPAMTEFFLKHTSFLPNEPIYYLSRPSVIRLLWIYIKQKRLQDTKDGRIIHLSKDPILKNLLWVEGTQNVLEVQQQLIKQQQSGNSSSTPTLLQFDNTTDEFTIRMPTMNALISKHLTKIERKEDKIKTKPNNPNTSNTGQLKLTSFLSDPNASASSSSSSSSSAPTSNESNDSTSASSSSVEDDYIRIDAMAREYERKLKHYGKHHTGNVFNVHTNNTSTAQTTNKDNNDNISSTTVTTDNPNTAAPSNTPSLITSNDSEQPSSKRMKTASSSSSNPAHVDINAASHLIDLTEENAKSEENTEEENEQEDEEEEADIEAEQDNNDEVMDDDEQQ